MFVGYGIQAPEYQWDDFKGVDLKGKVLLMLNNDPDWDPSLFAGTTRLYYGRWDYKYESAARQGAAGAIIIHTTPSAGYPFQVVQSGWSGEQFELPAGDEPRVQFQGWVTEEAARLARPARRTGSRRAGRGGEDRATSSPVPLGVTTSIAFENTAVAQAAPRTSPACCPAATRSSRARSSSTRRITITSASASRTRTATSIYNGALDNGVGVRRAARDLAKAFKALPTAAAALGDVAVRRRRRAGPARLGVSSPRTRPSRPGAIAANINFDERQHLGPGAATSIFIGKGKSSLDAVIDERAAEQDRIVKPDQFPDRGYFYRSDQFSFAKIGVPAFYQHFSVDFPGKPEGWGREQVDAFEEHRYHQPSDEFDAGVELRRHDGGRAAAVLRRPRRRQRGRDADLERGRRVRGRAQGGARRAVALRREPQRFSRFAGEY